MYRATYAYLFSTYGRRVGYWIGFAASFTQSLINRVILGLFQAHLAAMVVVGNLPAAQRDVLWYLGLGLGGLVLRYIRDIVGILSENDVYGQIMVRYYDKLVGKDLAFYRDHQTGYLAGTFRQHADGAILIARLWRGEIIQTAISLLAPMLVLAVLSPVVGGLLLIVVLAQGAYIWWSSNLTAPFRKTSHEVYRRISGQVSDDVTNIVAFKASGAALTSREHMSALADEEQTAYAARRQLLARLDTPRDAITFLGAAAVLWVVASTTHTAAQSVQLLILTITYMMQIYTAVQNLPKIVEEHDDLVAKLYPTLEYLTPMYESILDRPNIRPLAIARGAVEFRHVGFAYRTADNSRVSVFHELNLAIAGGEQVGVVGLSGAGKSTLASLLMRFDEVDTGAITIDGTDIRDVAQVDLRQHIAYVPQEPLLFHRSVRENITYFNPKASQQDIERAARAAHAHEFISVLPDGYKTLVGERGIKLSGGQKQRVVLARSILKNAPIMIFDEATSALDSESERIIQAAMPEILGKRTAIVIAHRLSTVAGLDRIVVMHDGRITESGTHAELLAKQGRYASLWQKQSHLGN